MSQFKVNKKIMYKLNIGCHLSIAQGYEQMAKNAVAIGANACQFFIRNPRGASNKPIEPDDALAMLKITQSHQFAQLLVHAPYTMNPCSAEAKTRALAMRMMQEDLTNMEKFFPGNLYTFHPGCHVGQGVATSIDFIAKMLNQVITASQSTIILLETMSGKGTEIGSTFIELQQIITKVDIPQKIGVCLDTCHVFSAGYDIVNNLDGVIQEFDQIIGLDKLHAIHLNDSMTPFNSKKDRHELIGQGTIGLAAISRIIKHPALKHLPFYLETPNDLPGYQREIALLRAS